MTQNQWNNQIFRQKGPFSEAKVLSIINKLPNIGIHTEELKIALEELSKDKSIKDEAIIRKYCEITSNLDCNIKTLQLLKNVIAEYWGYWLNAVLITQDNIAQIEELYDNPNFKAGGIGFHGFTEAVKHYKDQDTQVYFVFASNMPTNGSNFSSCGIQMYVSATTMHHSPITGNMGIERVNGSLGVQKTGGGTHFQCREISSVLHSFAADVTSKVNPDAHYMTTQPTLVMTSMMVQWFRDAGKADSLIVACGNKPAPREFFESSCGDDAEYAEEQYQQFLNWQASPHSVAPDKKYPIIQQIIEQNIRGKLPIYRPRDDTSILTLPGGAQVPFSDKWYHEHPYHQGLGGAYKILVGLEALGSLANNPNPLEFFLCEDREMIPHDISDADMSFTIEQKLWGNALHMFNLEL